MQTKGQTLRSLRKAKGLSQTETGIRCGMNKSQISKLENDKVANDALYERAFNALGYRNDVTLRQMNFPYTTEEILTALKAFKTANREQFGIDMLGLYGSCSRNEQVPGSDIDIAVKLHKPNLLKQIRLENDLQELFEVKTDVISLSSRFLPGFLESISKDLIYV